MNKKGFTLVELLAVIFILGIISVIFIPNVIDILAENSTKIYGTKEKMLVDAAKDYITLNEDFELPDGVTPTKYITINTLVNSNLSSVVLDNKSGNACTGFVQITVNSVYGYNYEACLLCDNYTTNQTFCTTATYDSI